MNSYATSARYMRVAVCALLLSLCGQTKCAGDGKGGNLLPIIGAALAAGSGITRHFYPPVSVLGSVLDWACMGTNLCAASGYQQKAPTMFAFVDCTCLFGLVLQCSGLVPALTLAVNDPLRPIRMAIGIANGIIIGSRLLHNYKHQETN